MRKGNHLFRYLFERTLRPVIISFISEVALVSLIERLLKFRIYSKVGEIYSHGDGSLLLFLRVFVSSIDVSESEDGYLIFAHSRKISIVFEPIFTSSV